MQFPCEVGEMIGHHNDKDVHEQSYRELIRIHKYIKVIPIGEYMLLGAAGRGHDAMILFQLKQGVRKFTDLRTFEAALACGIKKRLYDYVYKNVEILSREFSWAVINNHSSIIKMMHEVLPKEIIAPLGKKGIHDACLIGDSCLDALQTLIEILPMKDFLEDFQRGARRKELTHTKTHAVLSALQ